jgi:hypothetical protein
MLPSELVGGEANRQEFVSAYMKLLDAGLSILGESQLLPEEKQILKAFLKDGYVSLLKKYKKAQFSDAPMWMKEQVEKMGLGNRGQAWKKL